MTVPLPQELIVPTPPAAGVTTGSWAPYGVVEVAVDDPDYDSAREAFNADDAGNAGKVVVGKLGGSPAWLQTDDTPACATCDSPMRLVAQLEEGPDEKSGTAMNFGGFGLAFLFARTCGHPGPTFLWQC